jgi:hypothetical protein
VALVRGAGLAPKMAPIWHRTGTRWLALWRCAGCEEGGPFEGYREHPSVHPSTGTLNLEVTPEDLSVGGGPIDIGTRSTPRRIGRSTTDQPRPAYGRSRHGALVYSSPTHQFLECVPNALSNSAAVRPQGIRHSERFLSVCDDDSQQMDVMASECICGDPLHRTGPLPGAA